MTTAIEESQLSHRAFAECRDPRVTLLATALRGARDRVGQLTTRIVSSLPTLTMHQFSKLDRLWAVAGSLSGDEFFPIPLERYLFGTAVLLHDAALSFDASSGRQPDARETVQWNDELNSLRANQSAVDLAAVDFERPRTLHTPRPADLAFAPRDTDDGHHYIIAAAHPGIQYGPQIGDIASSKLGTPSI